MKLRRSLAASIAVSLLMFAAPAAVPVSAVGSACVDPDPNPPPGDPWHNKAWDWLETSSPNYGRTAIQAFIDIPGVGFDVCYPLDNDGGSVSHWVGLVLRDGDRNQIIQIGIGKSPAYATPFYFWATGGCGANPAPNAKFLAWADYARHPYVIFRTWVNWPIYGWAYRMQVNGGNGSSWNGFPGYSVDIAETDPQVSCWITYNKKAMWSGERDDRGDSLGNPPGQATRYDTMAFKATNSSNWQYPNFCPGMYPHQFYVDYYGEWPYFDLRGSSPACNSMDLWSDF